jgi:hypothetical protein
MSNQPTPSMGPPAGLASSGNGKYVVVVVLLMAAIGGLLAWRSCGTQQPTAQQTPMISKFDAAPTPHDDDNVPPPPPPDEPAPSASVARGPVGTYDPCSVKTCAAGKTTDDLETALGFRAHQAHRCYDQALAQDGDLKGHVTIAVRVASNGSLCSATVAANDMGSDGVANCVANVFRSSHTFPPPKGGCIDVKVPINFVPGGK